MALYQFLQDQGSIIGAAVAAVVGITGVYLTVLGARKDILTQIRANEKIYQTDRDSTEKAILEWYFGTILELRSFLIRETHTLRELYDVLREEVRHDRYQYMLESVRYQDFSLKNNSSRPNLINDRTINEFSLIEDNEIRARVLYLNLLINRTYEELGQNFYKMQRFLELHIDGNDRIRDIDETVEFAIAIRAYVISLLLNEAYELLEKIPFQNPFIENWQRDQEANAFRQLCEMNDEVVVPERCIDKEAEDNVVPEDNREMTGVFRKIFRGSPDHKKQADLSPAKPARASAETKIETALRELSAKISAMRH